MWEFFIYSGYKSLIRDTIYKYFFPFRGLFFIVLMMIANLNFYSHFSGFWKLPHKTRYLEYSYLSTAMARTRNMSIINTDFGFQTLLQYFLAHYYFWFLHSYHQKVILLKTEQLIILLKEEWPSILIHNCKTFLCLDL